MLPRETRKFMLDTLAASISYSKKALWSLWPEALRLVRQPICTPWFVIPLVLLWEFSETLSKAAISLSTLHTTGAGVRTWSLEATPLNLGYNTGIEHVGLVEFGSDAQKQLSWRAVGSSLLPTALALLLHKWCPGETLALQGRSQIVFAKPLDWSRKCPLLFPSTCRISSYVRGFELPVNFWLRGWEIRMNENWSVDVTQSAGCVCMGTIPLCVGSTFHHSLSCFGPWEADLERTISTGCLSLLLQMGSPRTLGAPQETCAGERERQILSWVAFLQGGQWEPQIC